MAPAISFDEDQNTKPDANVSKGHVSGGIRKSALYIDGHPA